MIFLADGKYGGTETGPMLDYCKKYNFTPLFIMADVNDFGQIYENGSSDGLTRFIVEGYGEVGFGNIINFFLITLNNEQLRFNW